MYTIIEMQSGKRVELAEDNSNADMCMSKMPCMIPRSNADVVSELAYERRDVYINLTRLNKAIEADPESVSPHHKELWRKQANAMKEYVCVLGERINDLIANDK